MTQAFILLSGGIDSAVCLKKAVNEHENIEAIHFNYGQQTGKIERRNAETQAEAEDIPIHVIDYRDVFKNFAEGTIEDKEYNQDHRSEQGHSVGYVLQRNLHFLVSAAALAEHHSKTDEEIVLYHGSQSNDEADYPDCRPEFMEAAQRAVNRSTGQHRIQIKAPLIGLSKKQVLKEGEKLGVDWSLTFSCYNDKDGEPCGECPACIEREEAFNNSRIADPVM